MTDGIEAYGIASEKKTPGAWADISSSSRLNLLISITKQFWNFFHWIAYSGAPSLMAPGAYATLPPRAATASMWSTRDLYLDWIANPVKDHWIFLNAIDTAHVSTTSKQWRRERRGGRGAGGK